MCNIGNAISRAFTPAGTGGLLSLESEAQDQANAANAALTKAIQDATAASTPVLDNPSALAASRAQMAKLMQGSATQYAFGAQPTVAPAVATKTLFGE